jgi:SAM-dependent methyltransferase
MESLQQSGEQTVADFGAQWTAYTDNEGYYASVDLLADVLEPLLPLAEIRGKRVADIGSGTGRIVNMLLNAGAAHVTAVEPSACFGVLKRNTAERGDRITYRNEPGDRLPATGDLDVVVSIGVLHHIPDPLPTVRAAYQALKPGGRMAAWLYGREGNEVYLAVALPIRKITRRLPHRGLALLSAALAIPLALYIRACGFLPLPMAKYMREVVGKLSHEQLRLTIYDQLNPAWAAYYRREEAEALFRNAGFVDVQLHHRHGYSWTVIGTRPEE